jgi:hypothetical protein
MTMMNTTQQQSNLETYCLIWFDNSVNNSQNIQAQNILRTSINHLLTFDDDERFFQHIDALSDDDRVILIVSGRLGQTIVPQVSPLRQIVSIYIYCMDKKANEQWAQNFIKVNILDLDCFYSILNFVFNKIPLFEIGKKRSRSTGGTHSKNSV